MPSAEDVANALASEFLRRGNYSASAGPITLPDGAGAAPAAAHAADLDIEEEALDAFGSLAVQSVGYEVGVEEPKVRIYLTRSSAALLKALPDEVDGVPVVAEKMGPVSVRPEAAASATNRPNVFERGGRVCCGSSCAPTSENCSGTLGALVRRNGSDELYLLSNNHVFGGCNHVPLDQPILAPSSNDGRPDLRAPGEIGRHYAIHELRSGDPSFITPTEADLAIARATDPDIVSSWQGDDATGFDTPAASSAPVSRMRVKKVGRTTGLTHGVVQTRVARASALTYNSKHFKSVVWFRNVWTIKASGAGVFALPGDSGSLVVSEDGATAVGVLYAANRTGEYGWIIPMPYVETTFGGIRLVRGHGV